jgi:hypothetical protein
VPFGQDSRAHSIAAATDVRRPIALRELVLDLNKPTELPGPGRAGTR